MHSQNKSYDVNRASAELGYYHLYLLGRENHRKAYMRFAGVLRPLSSRRLARLNGCRFILIFVVLIVTVYYDHWFAPPTIYGHVTGGHTRKRGVTKARVYSACSADISRHASKSAKDETFASLCFKEPMNAASTAEGHPAAVRQRLCQVVKTRHHLALSRAENLCAWLVPANPATAHYIYHAKIKGRLGNFFFALASLIGIARENNLIPTLTIPDARTKDLLLNVVPILQQSTVAAAIPVIPHKVTALKKKEVPLDQDLLHVGEHQKSERIALRGFLQSWKYFYKSREDVRTIFTFGKAACSTAIKTIVGGLHKMHEGNLTADSTLVAVHIRRGDILSGPHKRFGHVPATKSYLRNTATHVEKKYGYVVFFVLGDDVAYSKSVFSRANYVFVDGNSPAADMALMTLMDVIVLTVGSFGWWGAYLSDAKEVFYYSDWPRPGSEYHNMTKKEDYFLPSWNGRT